MSKIELHFPADGDFPETSGEMRAERHCVLAYTESLGWTQAIRRRVGKRAFEWVCSNYDGNTLFSDDEITAWTELPEPQAENEATDNMETLKERCRILDESLVTSTKNNIERQKIIDNQKEQLTKARKIILKLYNAGRDVLMCRTEEKAYNNLSEAINDRGIEQFLEEVEE